MARRATTVRLGAVVAAAALLIAAAGCRKQDDAAPVAEDVPPALAGTAAMPASIDTLVGLDVGRLAGSPLIERGALALLAGDATLARQLGGFFEACSIDVARDLRRVWLGMDREGGAPTMMVVEGRLGEGQLNACVGKAIAGRGGRLTGERIGGRTHYHIDQGDGRPGLWFAVVGEGMVAVASSAGFLAAGVGSGPKLSANAELQALVERAGIDHAVWFAGAVPLEVGSGLGTASGGALGPPRAMFGHLDLDGGLAAELGVVMASAAEADKAVSLVKPQLETMALVLQAQGLGRLINRIAPSATGDTLFLRVVATEAEVRDLVGTAVDSGQGGDQNASPPRQERQEGVDSDGQRDPAPGGEAPVRK